MIPGLGELCLDPASLALLPMPALPGSPRLPTASWTFAIPATAQGVSVWLQELHADAAGTPRLLTNCEVLGF